MQTSCDFQKIRFALKGREMLLEELNLSPFSKNQTSENSVHCIISRWWSRLKSWHHTVFHSGLYDDLFSVNFISSCYFTNLFVSFYFFGHFVRCGVPKTIVQLSLALPNSTRETCSHTLLTIMVHQDIKSVSRNKSLQSLFASLSNTFVSWK